MAKGFTFKQFHVDDGGCGMAVSTDGVLLGAWATLPKRGKLIDIGTGSGLLALMMAQRIAPALCSITAIELDNSAADAAAKNFSNSPWSSSLHCVKQDIQQWARTQPKNNIENIICNPPYFNFGLQADNQIRATARHTDTLTHDVLLQSITYLLAPKGIVSLILPEYEGQKIIQAAEKYGLQCQRLCEVKSTERKPVSRLLIELTPSTVKLDTKKETLCIHNSGQYSAQFVVLTRDFYLKL